MICRKSEKDSAERTAALLKAGKVVIIPTDTVYGFSGIVDTETNGFSYKTDAVIRQIKGRAETKPLIQLLAAPDDVYKYTDTQIPSDLLCKWPGALTIIVKNKNSEATTAFRCPGDEWLRQVISLCGSPVYSTSVNRSGCPVLSSIKEIVNEFEDECSLIVDSGDTANALPSTIVSVLDGKVTVIRQGAVKILL